jgi:hypothetical protein
MAVKGVAVKGVPVEGVAVGAVSIGAAHTAELEKESARGSKSPDEKRVGSMKRRL